MIIFLICVIAVICLIAWVNLKYITYRPDVYEKIKNFQGTNRTLPIVGDLYLAFGKSMNDKTKVFMKIIDQFETTMKFWFGFKLVIVVNDPEDAKTVLTSPYCLNKAPVYNKAIGGAGIFVAKGHHWKNQRRHLNATFNIKLLHSDESKYNDYARAFSRDLEIFANTGIEFDVANIAGTHVTDLIINTLYGSDNHQIVLSEKCYHIIKSLMLVWGQRTLKITSALVLMLVQKLFNIASNESKLIKKLRSSIEPIIAKREEEYRLNQEKMIHTSDDVNEKNFNSEIFIEKLIRLRHNGCITYHEYRHNTLTMFLAGSDTSASSIANVILMLAMHQHHQEMVYDEIFRILGADDINSNIDLQKLNELHVLDRVIRETFRLFPVSPFVGRTAEHDVKLAHGIVPAGTDIIISIINLQRNTKVWGPNSNRFDPDNFLDEHVEKRHRCSYIPFSYGPRNCIGSKFAQISTYLAVICLVRNYRFTTKLKFDELNFGFALTTFLFNGHMVSIEKRCR